MTLLQRRLNIIFRITIFVSFAFALLGSVSLFMLGTSGTFSIDEQENVRAITWLDLSGWGMLCVTVVSVILSLILVKTPDRLHGILRTVIIAVSLVFQLVGSKGLRIVHVIAFVMNHFDPAVPEMSYQQMGLNDAQIRLIDGFMFDHAGEGSLVFYVIAVVGSMLAFAALAVCSVKNLIAQKKL